MRRALGMMLAAMLLLPGGAAAVEVPPGDWCNLLLVSVAAGYDGLDYSEEMFDEALDGGTNDAIAACEDALAFFTENGIVPEGTAASAPVARRPMTTEGQGSEDTEAIHLTGGDYRVEATASARAGGLGCFHSSRLSPAEGFGMEAPLTLTPDAGKSESATTRIYDLDPGRYYWSVNSGCAWSLTITPE